MLCTLQTRDNKFRHGERIRRSKDGRGDILQTSLQETQIKDGVLHQLVTVPTSQIFAVRVGQHMGPARNSNKGRRTNHCSHNWSKHWQLVCGINGKTVYNGHSNPTESALLLLPCPQGGPQWLTTLLEFKAVKMMSLRPTNHSRQNSGQHSINYDRLTAKQQCESGMIRRGSGNLRNLTKLRLVSRRLLYSLARRLAQTAPTTSRLVHSCLPSSARLPSRTPSSELATEGQRHQLRQ